MIPLAILPAGAVQHAIDLASWRWDDPTLERWTRQQLPQALDRRRVEFAAGRRCAATVASRLLGRAIHPTEIPRHPTGGPVWPAGVVGSVAHCRHLAGAIAKPHAMTGPAGLGLDVEPIMRGERVAAVQRRIIRPDEAAGMRQRLPLSDAETTTIAFAVKEALFKCLHPLVGQMFFFNDAWIDGVEAGRVDSGASVPVAPDDRSGSAADADLKVQVRLTSGLGPDMSGGRTFPAAVAIREGVVYAVISL